MTYREIANRFGLTESPVRSRLGLKPKWSRYRRPGEAGYSTITYQGDDECRKA
jgi:hypothetical protein